MGDLSVFVCNFSESEFQNCHMTLYDFKTVRDQQYQCEIIWGNIYLNASWKYFIKNYSQKEDDIELDLTQRELKRQYV